MRRLKGATRFYCWAFAMTDTPLGPGDPKYTNKADEYTVTNATFKTRDENPMLKQNVAFFPPFLVSQKAHSAS